MTQEELQSICDAIPAADAGAMDLARRRQAQLAKPPGSLGALEEISIRLAGITGWVHNQMDRCRVTVLAADNGIVAEGVSSAPQSVTLAQAINMTLHKTGMSVLAACFENDVQVVDVGIAAQYHCPAILDRRIRHGTESFLKAPAMTRQETLDAIAVGLSLAAQAKAEGYDAMGAGEMGIGNTTTSAAVLAALTGAAVEQVTGRGGGVTDAAFAKKKQVIARGLALHRPDPADPVDVLSKVGGLDLAAMTGVFLGCARERLPAVVDGFISVVAALCAVRLCPRVRDVLFLSHISYEIGYSLAAKELALQPFLQLGMRLGEGSGCPLAFQILKGACAVMNRMATFQEAAIQDDYLEEIRKGDQFTVKT